MVLGRDLTPEFEVTSGVRRLSEQQASPLRALKVEITPEVIETRKMERLLGRAAQCARHRQPRTAAQARRDPARVGYLPDQLVRGQNRWRPHRAHVSRPEAGHLLRRTCASPSIAAPTSSARRPSPRPRNLRRLQIRCRPQGLHDRTIPRESIWRDPARAWQEYGFGGAVNKDSVALKARNRVAIIESDGGSLAFFPPSHKFFFAREIETNLGFVYYRKTGEQLVRGGRAPGRSRRALQTIGVSDEEWEKRAHEARHDINNFALYNAPPGTMAAHARLLLPERRQRSRDR